MQEQEQDNKFESSSTDTSRSSPFETPEVHANGRPPLDTRVRKSKQQEAKIAELQAQLKAREDEFEKLQEKVLRTMTQESLTNTFPSTPTYVDIDGQLITKLQLLQDEMKAKEKTFRETMMALESHRHLQATIPLETFCININYSNKQRQRMNLHNTALPLSITLTLTRTLSTSSNNLPA